MIGPRALFGSAFALVAVGAAMGLSDPGNTTRSSTLAEANAVGASPAPSGKARNSGDGSATNPAGKPGAVAAAWSTVDNDKLTMGTTGASPSTNGLLGTAGTGERRATRSVEAQARPGPGPAPAETGAAPEAKKEAQEPQPPQAPKPPARARSQKPAVSVARSQRQRDARPEAAPVASAPQPIRAVSSARVIDESSFLR